MSDTINIELSRVALERVSGSQFEKFFHAFYPAIEGINFVPLGGTHDGGADAYWSSSIYEIDVIGIYYQASVEQNYRSKIKRTIERITHFGRSINQLIYVTNQLIPRLDVEESKLSIEHGIRITIRDRAYITSHINDSDGSKAAFITYLAPELDYLKTLGSAKLLIPTKVLSSPELYVFLTQELDRREGKINLKNSLVDSLILWSLEGTNPDKQIFMTKTEIINKISETVPSAMGVLKTVVSKRLRALSKTPHSENRPIRYFKKRDNYCLAIEFRRIVEAENTSDEVLHLNISEIFERRIKDTLGDKCDPKIIKQAVDLSLQVIQKTFEQQGIEFSAFLEDKIDSSNITISDHVDEILQHSALSLDHYLIVKEAILGNLQKAFYEGERAERLYFSRLASTYTLLFCLNKEPRILEYFQSMTADFYLYVGSDILIRALSERYVDERSQATRNALKFILEAGGKLVLTEPVLEEVYHHIYATDKEFINNYQQIESNIDKMIARNSDRILIRAYFYAKWDILKGDKTFNWSKFIGQFCDYDSVDKSRGKEQLKRFLVAQFNLEFETMDVINQITDATEVKSLAAKLVERNKDPKLAMHDAQMVFAVYGRRKLLNEHSELNIYGYKTWWLTGETLVLDCTREIVGREGARYMMRPSFVLNFLSLAPSAAEARRRFRDMFPSIIGIKLARRVDKKELLNVLEKVAEAKDLEPGRLSSITATLSDNLKSEFYSVKNSKRPNGV